MPLKSLENFYDHRPRAKNAGNPCNEPAGVASRRRRAATAPSRARVARN